jgi:MvaI/BcnI restriction endonuclease family
VAVRTVEELERKMRELMGKWHNHIELPGKLGTKRKTNDGDAGHTLEALLGVAENNLKLRDFGEVELKTSKYEGKSLLTLFHHEPTPLENKAVTPSIVRSLGWKHSKAGIEYPETEKRFTSTTYGNYYTVRGMSLECDEQKIYIKFDPTKINLSRKDKTENYKTYKDWLDDIESRTDDHYSKFFPIPFSLSEVIQWFQDKLDQTLLVLRKTRIADERKQHYYVEAYLLKDLKPEMIVPLINNGNLSMEFDARTGHNHGLKFRIKKKELGSLFSFYDKIQ